MTNNNKLEKVKKVETVLYLDQPFINLKAKPRQKLVGPDEKYIITGWVQSEGSEIRVFLESYNFKFLPWTEDGTSSKIANIPVTFEDGNKIIKFISNSHPEAWEKYNRKDGIRAELNRQRLTVIDYECNDIDITTTITKPTKPEERRCLEGTIYARSITDTEKGSITG